MSDKAKLIFTKPIIGGSGAARNENCSVELLGLAIYGHYRHGYSLPCLDDAAQRVVVQINDRLSDEARNSRRWRLLVARLALCHRHDNERLHRRMALWCARSVEHLSDDPRVKACNDTLERWLAGEATDEEAAARAAAAAEAAARAAAAAEAAARAAAAAARTAARAAAAAWTAAWTAAEAARTAAEAAAWTAAIDDALMDWLDAYLTAWHKTAVDEGEALIDEQEAELLAFVDSLNALAAVSPEETK